MSYFIFDGLALGDILSDTKTPKPFRLFKTGENLLTRNGKDYQLTLSAEDIAAIADYQRKKGEKIPIDSRHALFFAAEKAGVKESDMLRMVPSNVAALGFAALESRPDGLWAVDVELSPLAAELLQNGSLRYWSPVVRGLDGRSPLRVTSIAMDNVPALNNLDILAAGGENIKTMSGLPDQTMKGDCKMSNLTEKALRKLLGDDALVLSDTTDTEIAGKVEALAAELESLRADKAKLEALELAGETQKREQLIDQAIKENRVTNAEKDGLMQLDSAWLAAELSKRPANALPKEIKKDDDVRDDKNALTEAEKAFAAERGITEEEYLKAKKEASER